MDEPEGSECVTEEERVFGKGEGCWIIAAAAKDVHNVLVASQA